MHFVIFSKNCLADKGPECGYMSGHRELFPSGVEGACVTDMAGRRGGTEPVWLRSFLALHFTSYAPLHVLTLWTGASGNPFGFIFIVRQRRQTQAISRYNLKYH